MTLQAWKGFPAPREEPEPSILGHILASLVERVYWLEQERGIPLARHVDIFGADLRLKKDLTPGEFIGLVLANLIQRVNAIETGLAGAAPTATMPVYGDVPRGGTRVTVTGHVQARMVQMRQAGHTLREIAAETGFCTMTVQNQLDRARGRPTGRKRAVQIRREKLQREQDKPRLVG